MTYVNENALNNKSDKLNNYSNDSSVILSYQNEISKLTL